MDHNIVEVQEDNTGKNTDPIGFRHHTKDMIDGDNCDKLDFTEIDFFLGLELRALIALSENPRFCSQYSQSPATQFQGNPMLFPDFQGHQAHIQCSHINTNINAHKNLKISDLQKIAFKE